MLSVHVSDTVVRIDREYRDVVLAHVGREPRDLLAAVFVSALGLADENPARMAVPAALLETAVKAARALCRGAVHRSEEPDVAPAAVGRPEAAVPPASDPAETVEPQSSRTRPHLRHREETAEAANARDQPAEAEPQGLEPAVTSSAFGGLFFATAVLQYLGFSDYLEQHPDVVVEGVYSALLQSIAESAGASVCDPVVASLNAPGDSSDQLTDTVQRWHRAARKWTRREARMLLTWLVRRPAQIASTRTHVDIYFDLAQADLRVRRLGLDIDPGWVPALGKVIRYHYGRLDR
jgi:hypothetical protein